MEGSRGDRRRMGGRVETEAEAEVEGEGRDVMMGGKYRKPLISSVRLQVEAGRVQFLIDVRGRGV